MLPLLLAATLLAQGVVKDGSGTPLPGASVYERAGEAFTVTDGHGRFEMTVPAGAVLVATFPGLKAAEATVAPGVPVTFVLGIPAQTETVTVKARAGSGTAEATQRLTRLQLLRMPGAAADALRAAQMMPGVAKADEGAGLFVRGGDVSETATYLDRALVPHPYRAESGGGGLFGTVPNALISGLSLSTGGFPARYGGALSGVLELDGLGAPTTPSWQATLGLAGAAALVSQPLGSGWGLRASANQSATRLLFAVNPPRTGFSRYPEHTDASVGLYGSLGGAGRVRLFALGDREAVGVEVERDAFRGPLDTRRRHGMAALGWERLFADRWLVTLTGSGSAYERGLDVGVTRLETTEQGRRLRLDAMGTVQGGTVRAGLELDAERVRRTGTTPVRGGDLFGTSGVRAWDQLHRATRRGAYVEMERTAGPFRLSGGARADHFAPQRQVRVDPRLSAVWHAGAAHRLRVAGGFYHQAPDPAYLDAQLGNPGLGLMRARHLVLGYEHGRPDAPLQVRVEAYDKSYRGLPVEDAGLRFTSSGHGVARGLDVLLALRDARVDGFVAYSALFARRLHTPFEERGRGIVYGAPVPPSFAVPHTVQAGLRFALPRALSLGVGGRIASGGPYTPIVGARNAAGGLVPVYGGAGSERLPAYSRLDLALSRAQPLGSGTLVLFSGLTNALDHVNVFDYAYSPDYTQRRPVVSNWGRSVYVGASYAH